MNIEEEKLPRKSKFESESPSNEQIKSHNVLNFASDSNLLCKIWNLIQILDNPSKFSAGVYTKHPEIQSANTQFTRKIKSTNEALFEPIKMAVATQNQSEKSLLEKTKEKLSNQNISKESQTYKSASPSSNQNKYPKKDANQLLYPMNYIPRNYSFNESMSGYSVPVYVPQIVYSQPYYYHTYDMSGIAQYPYAVFPSENYIPCVRPQQIAHVKSSDNISRKLTNEEYAAKIIEPFEKSNDDFSLLKGEIIKLSCFQSGSRYLQKKLSQGKKEFTEFVFSEVNK